MAAGDEYKCGWCRSRTFRKRKKFGGRHGLSIRLCRECLPRVIAIDVGGVVAAIEFELSTKFVEIRSAA